MSDIDNPDNGGLEPRLEDEIALELQHIEELVRNLRPMVPATDKDVAELDADIERIQEQLRIYDERAMEMLERGELTEDVEITRIIGKAMNDIEAGLRRLLDERDLVMSVRMDIGNALEELGDIQEELQ